MGGREEAVSRDVDTARRRRARMQNKSSQTSRLRRAASERGDGFRRVLLERTCTTTQKVASMSEMIVVKDSTITTCAMAGLGIFSHAERSSTSSAFAAGLASPKGFAAAPDLAKGLAPAPGADPNAPVSAKGDAPAAGGLDALAGEAAPMGLPAATRARRRRRGSRALRPRRERGRRKARPRRRRGSARPWAWPGRRAPRRACRTGCRLARAFRARRGLVRLEGVLERQRLLARDLPLAERAREGFGRPLARLRHRRRRLLGRVVLRGADGQPSPPRRPRPPRRGRHPPERRSRAAARPEARARAVPRATPRADIAAMDAVEIVAITSSSAHHPCVARRRMPLVGAEARARRSRWGRARATRRTRSSRPEEARDGNRTHV